MSKKKPALQEQSWQKKVLPHALILVGVVILMIAYFKPAVVDGKKIRQDDMIQYQGGIKEIKEFRERTGEEALWTNGMFGGMPAYQISLHHPGNWFQTVDQVLRFGLPYPVDLMFRIFIGFYLLLILLRVNPWMSGIGALAFAFSSYFFIVLEVGHNTKLNAIAMMAPIISGFILAYRGRYLLGGALVGLFTALEVNANHWQITYYLLFVLAALVISYLVDAIREKKMPQFVKATVVVAAAGLIAIGPNTSRLWTTYEYAKETIRGQSELTPADPNAPKPGDGLDKDYAFRWSYGISETFTLLVPHFKGGSSGMPISENTETFEVLKNNFGENWAKSQIENWPTYWGDQPLTAGPVYVGALICFLFVLGIIILRGPLKWALLGVTGLAIMLAWGRHFSGLTEFMFNHFPMYNKFRAPAMWLVVPEVTMPIIGILALKKFFESKDESFTTEKKVKALYISAGVVGGLLLLFAALGGEPFGLTADGKFEMFQDLIRRWGVKDNNKILTAAGGLADALVNDQNSMLRMDALRSLAFILAGAGLMWAYTKQKLKNINIVYAGLAIIILIDMWPVCARYLQDSDFVKVSKFKETVAETDADRAIKADAAKKGMVHYRVINVSNRLDRDGTTAAHHRVIGGYHAAKLRRYQELLERQVGMNNQAVWDMLNTAYFLQRDAEASAQAQRPIFRYGPRQPAGNAWAVPKVKFVKNADEEIAALDDFKCRITPLSDRAIVAINGKRVTKDTIIREPMANLTISNSMDAFTNPDSAANRFTIALYNLPISEGNPPYKIGSEGDAANVLSSMPMNLFDRRLYDYIEPEHLEIEVLQNFEAKAYAVVDERFKSQLDGLELPPKESASIKLLMDEANYDPRKMTYEFESQSDQLVVFSEIYYNSGKGWNAYINDQPVEHLRANYVLRGLRVPAGKHTIEFRFEPTSYYTGTTVSMIFSLILLLSILGIFYWELRPVIASFREEKKQEEA